MTQSHQSEVDAWWAAEMALPPEIAPWPRGILCTAQRLYSGVQLIRRADSLVIAAPPALVDSIAAGVREVPPERVFSVDFVERLPGLRIEKILGPAHVSYADASTFRFAPADGCRLLTAEDVNAREALRFALSPIELEQSGLDSLEVPAAGAFAEGALAAVASYEVWEPRIAHLTVATHPDHRRHGQGRAAVSCLARHALDCGLVLQYRALASNSGSLALGRSLGFQPFCSTIYARLASVCMTFIDPDKE